MVGHSGTREDPHARARKQQLRDQLLAARKAVSPAELGVRARALADLLLEVPEVRRAATVAAYLSVGSEPGTGPLLDALRASGRRVLLPVTLPDLDLDWAAYDGDDALAPGPLRTLAPTGPRLGVDAVGGADVVLLPGLAVDHHGRRMGRGGGCYDRALARVPVGTLTCVLLHPGELLDDVPTEPHDRPVLAAATPEGLVRF